MDEYILDEPVDFDLAREAVAFDYITDSREAVAELDRSSLGFLAVHDEVLAAALAVETTRVDSYSDDVDFALLTNAKWVNEATLANAIAKHGFPYPCDNPVDAARAEVFLWWSKSNLHTDYITLSKFAEVNRIRAFLELCESHVGGWQYYSVGIDSREFAERCIADGIDPEIAAVLYRNAGAS